MAKNYKTEGEAFDAISEKVSKAYGAVGLLHSLSEGAGLSEFVQSRPDVVEGFLWLLDDLLWEAKEAIKASCDISNAERRADK